MFKYDRKAILQVMLKYDTAFNNLIDYVIRHKSIIDIPTNIYLQQYKDIIVASEDELAIKLLSFDSLLASNFISYSDSKEGVFSLLPFLVDMLTFIDTTRIRELSQADFEKIRSEFERFALMIGTDVDISPGKLQYNDQMVCLFELINETREKVRKNIEALSASVTGLKQRYDCIDDGTEFSSNEVNSLLSESMELYERYIRPCHEFLSPSVSMRNSSLTFTQSFEKLIQSHELAQHNKHSGKLNSYRTSIRSYYKDIAELDSIIRKYNLSLESDRKKYKAIESAYTDLLNEIKSLRHGKAKNFKLRADAECFIKRDFLVGLSKNSAVNNSKINWLQDTARSHVHEWLDSISSNPIKAVAGKVEQLPPPEPEDERKLEVMMLMIQKSWDKPFDDLHAHLAGWLKEELDDFSLSDLLPAIHSATDIERIAEHITYHPEIKSITDDTYFIDYIRGSYSPVITETENTLL